MESEDDTGIKTAPDDNVEDQSNKKSLPQDHSSISAQHTDTSVCDESDKGATSINETVVSPCRNTRLQTKLKSPAGQENLEGKLSMTRSSSLPVDTSVDRKLPETGRRKSEPSGKSSIEQIKDTNADSDINRRITRGQRKISECNVSEAESNDEKDSQSKSCNEQKGSVSENIAAVRVTRLRSRNSESQNIDSEVKVCESTKPQRMTRSRSRSSESEIKSIKPANIDQDKEEINSPDVKITLENSKMKNDSKGSEKQQNKAETPELEIIKEVSIRLETNITHTKRDDKQSQIISEKEELAESYINISSTKKRISRFQKQGQCNSEAVPLDKKDIGETISEIHSRNKNTAINTKEHSQDSKNSEILNECEKQSSKSRLEGPISTRSQANKSEYLATRTRSRSQIVKQEFANRRRLRSKSDTVINKAVKRGTETLQDNDNDKTVKNVSCDIVTDTKTSRKTRKSRANTVDNAECTASREKKLKLDHMEDSYSENISNISKEKDSDDNCEELSADMEEGKDNVEENSLDSKSVSSDESEPAKPPLTYERKCSMGFVVGLASSVDETMTSDDFCGTPDIVKPESKGSSKKQQRLLRVQSVDEICSSLDKLIQFSEEYQSEETESELPDIFRVKNNDDTSCSSRSISPSSCSSPVSVSALSWSAFDDFCDPVSPLPPSPASSDIWDPGSPPDITEGSLDTGSEIHDNSKTEKIFKTKSKKRTKENNNNKEAQDNIDAGSNVFKTPKSRALVASGRKRKGAKVTVVSAETKTDEPIAQNTSIIESDTVIVTRKSRISHVKKDKPVVTNPEQVETVAPLFQENISQDSPVTDMEKIEANNMNKPKGKRGRKRKSVEATNDGKQAKTDPKVSVFIVLNDLPKVTL